MLISAVPLVRRHDERRRGPFGARHLGEQPHRSDPELGQGVHLQGDVGVRVPAAFLGDHHGCEVRGSAQLGRLLRHAFLLLRLDRLRGQDQPGELEILAVPAPQLGHHGMVLMHVRRVLERRVAELAAHDRAVVQLVGIDEGRRRAAEALTVDEDVFERALRLQIGDGADAREAARSGVRDRREA